MNDIRDSITANNGKFMEAFGRQNAAAIAALYTDDAKILPPGSPMASGTSAIKDFWDAVFGLGFRQVSLETGSVDGGGELAAEVGRFHLSGQNGDEKMEASGKYVVVWKNDGGWKLHVDIWNTDE